MNNIYQKKIYIVGCGESGIAMANWCQSQGAIVEVFDSRQNPPLANKLKENIKFNFGINITQKPDLILVSPGLSPYFSELKNIYTFAKSNNIPIYGEIWLFEYALNTIQNYKPKILAITGTNGKTTTTSLTGYLCEYAGFSVVKAGNISPSLIDAFSYHYQNNSLPQIWVLELSSFQLFNVKNFKADASAILNISSDHLDWHIDLDDYINCKLNIFGQNTIHIMNRQDKYLQKYVDKNSITFGTDFENTDFCLNKHADGYWLYYQKDLMPVNAMKIRGLHNAQNALASLALCNAINIEIDRIVGGLRQYQGEPHRVELIDIINDIEIYDDSKGTNIGATIAAINGLQKQIVLIAGGDGKGQDFNELQESLKTHVKSAHLIGKDKNNLAKICDTINIPYYTYETLEEATIKAYESCLPNQALLLSPACASLDMFKNYVHRAEVFRKTINQIKNY